MTKIDIFSGFLGAGKTTLIAKLIKEAYTGEKVVLIENEFGEIGIDGGFLQDAGVEITEMNSGCICCSLVGDFGKALEKVLNDFAPDRILIEPSGVGKLSDVIRAVEKVEGDAVLNGFTTVVDANKARMYIKNFGEFFNNQVEFASAIILSHTAGMSDEKLRACVALLREHNKDAVIVTTDWEQLSGSTILEAIENHDTLENELKKLHDEEICPVCGNHHDHEHDHDHDHEHDHDHDHDHEHEHDHDHEHEHHHDGECSCGCHDHEHHHADEVFTSWGRETTNRYTAAGMQKILEALLESDSYGTVLRAKGIVPCEDGGWLHFDYVPGEPDVRSGSAGVTGRICVIGSGLNEEALARLFSL